MRNFIGDTQKHGVVRVVWDPFAGTGTTGVIAVQSGCVFLGTEIDEELHKVIITTIFFMFFLHYYFLLGGL